MRERCDNTVAINFPCALSRDHTGVCQPDPEGQLRIYGITVENLREIQRDLAEARRLGLVRGDGTATVAMKYLRLRAGLERIIPRAGPGGLVRSDSIWHAIEEAETP